MIAKLELHRKIKNLVIKRLEAAGIDCKETNGNDPNGDILIIRREDVARVQEIILSLNAGEAPQQTTTSTGAKDVRRRRG